MSSPYIEWTRFPVKNMGISLTREVAMYSVGLFLWMCLSGLRNILASGFDNCVKSSNWKTQ